MSVINIGRHSYHLDTGVVRLLKVSPDEASQLNNSIRRYDHLLHHFLNKIFEERCLSNREQIREFLRGLHRCDTDEALYIQFILDKERILREHLSHKDFFKLSLLWITVLASYKRSAELLIRFGADVNQPFGDQALKVVKSHWTILHLLLRTPRNERLISLAVDHGANLEARDSNGETFLHYAAMNGYIEMIKTLLERGADVTAIDDFGQNAMDYLAKADVSEVSLNIRAAVARILIEKGILRGDKDQDDCLPIHWAIIRGNSKLVKLFMDLGEDVNALLNGQPLLHLLIQNARNISEPRKMMETLLGGRANVDLRSSAGETALHAICAEFAAPADQLTGISFKLLGLLRLLLAAGADVLAENNLGETPLGRLFRDGHYDSEATNAMIRMLAARKVADESLIVKDEGIMKQRPETWKYYEDCIAEALNMKSTTLVETWTLLDFLVKCRCQIAYLMLDKKFELSFRCCELSRFPNYEETLQEAHVRSQIRSTAMTEQGMLINEAVNVALPEKFINMVLSYIFNDCHRCTNLN